MVSIKIPFHSYFNFLMLLLYEKILKIIRILLFKHVFGLVNCLSRFLILIVFFYFFILASLKCDFWPLWIDFKILRISHSKFSFKSDLVRVNFVHFSYRSKHFLVLLDFLWFSIIIFRCLNETLKRLFLIFEINRFLSN